MNNTTTLLARKDTPTPFAKDDEHHQMLCADSSITEFPQISLSQTNFEPINLTQAGDNAAQNAEILIENTNKEWINKRWRPTLAWSYIITCIMDFTIFPILWSLLQMHSHGQVASQWQPLTLMGAGLYHIAMGACIGITSYGRTKEKIEGKS